jgi:outer membrane protein assembly factor BamB
MVLTGGLPGTGRCQVQEEWSARFDGQRATHDEPSALAIDDVGSVYVTGFSEGEVLPNGRLVALKYDRSGNVMWAAETADLAAWKGGEAIAVNRAQQVYIAGGGEQPRATLFKYDADGSLAWMRSTAIGGTDEVRFTHLALDDEENAHAVGIAWTSNTYVDILVAKYSPQGDLLWQRTYDQRRSAYDYVHSIAVDRTGSLYLTGSTGGTNDVQEGFTTIKYAADGTRVWDERLEDGRGHAVIVDPQGSALVAGEGGEGTRLIKYEPDGQRLWLLDRDAGAYGVALAADATGSVFLLLKQSGAEYRLEMLDPRGEASWSVPVGRTASPLSKIVLGSEGGIYLTRGDYGICKYDAKGNPLWCVEPRIPAEAKYLYIKDFAVDASGSILLTGWLTFLVDRETYSGFFTVKLSTGLAPTSFRRGDANTDGAFNLADPIFTLNALFRGGPQPPCADAADADDDGDLNLTDGVYTLDHLFQGGVSPPSPGPTACGADSTDDDLAECRYEPARC